VPGGIANAVNRRGITSIDISPTLSGKCRRRRPRGNADDRAGPTWRLEVVEETVAAKRTASCARQIGAKKRDCTVDAEIVRP